MTRIAVAGATGVVGRHVLAALERAGHDAVPLSRRGGVDVRTGEGLTEALEGAAAVVDVLNVQTQSASEATTRRLLEAEEAAGVGHHVLLSIVGIDQADAGYYAGKLAQERAVSAGAVPWTILRATQFHEFGEQVLGMVAVGPLSLVPSGRVRPVAAAEVGAMLADLAACPARRETVDLRGPREERLLDMARRAARAGDARRVVVPVFVPGAVGRAMRNGALCGDETARQGRQTFAEWTKENR